MFTTSLTKIGEPIISAIWYWATINPIHNSDTPLDFACSLFCHVKYELFTNREEKRYFLTFLLEVLIDWSNDTKQC